MEKFKDSAGNDRVVHLTVRKARQVLTMLGLDLFTPVGENSCILKLQGPENVILRLDVLWELVKGPASTDTDKDEFEALLEGDSLAAAELALVREIVNFIQNKEVRETLQAFLVKTMKQQSELTVAAMKTLSEMKVEDLLKEQQTPKTENGNGQLSMSGSSSPPASSELIPGSTPSVN